MHGVRVFKLYIAFLFVSLAMAWAGKKLATKYLITLQLYNEYYNTTEVIHL